ncbi:hypothetical protein A9Q87_05515 [Flavobacteriales bacterium 34_180_T64]|nr:hypothetical protein A9Q87_05515 [Flavobacteriales bacterium 34_180_T64]
MEGKSKYIHIIIVAPVYNDWESFQFLIEELVHLKKVSNIVIEEVVAVNDGSTQSIDQDKSFSLPITIVNLNNNMGHQRAISIGLSYVNDHLKEVVDQIVVMDCDGEDRPEDIYKLVQAQIAANNKSIIFAKREKRSESFLFKLFYLIYKYVFSLLTTQHIDFGNYSSIPRSLVEKTVSIPELWNHYSGAIIKSKISYLSIGTDRGKRYHGSSKMNFQNLVLHGLSSISIYLDIVSVRLLFLSFFSSIIVGVGLLVILFLGLFTNIIVSSWSSAIGLILINILAIVILTTFLILLFQLNQKSSVKYPPKSFYKTFILSISNFNN